jgi:hypothetical protein
MFEDAAGLCPEDDAAKANLLGLAWAGGFCVFTGTHGEEEGSWGDVGCLGVSQVLFLGGSAG